MTDGGAIAAADETAVVRAMGYDRGVEVGRIGPDRPGDPDG